jgi:hypothetical protein
MIIESMVANGRYRDIGNADKFLLENLGQHV